MSSFNSIFSSAVSEKRWLIETNKKFPKDHVVHIDSETTPPCVFKVPKRFTDTKPEAYAPEQVGLGPYHHLRPDLYAMQRKKLTAINKFLNPEQLQNFPAVVDAIVQMEPFIRDSYDQYLDLDPATLAWILAIDAAYLALFLKNYYGCNNEDTAAHEDGENSREKLTGDILMLENQIPFPVIHAVLEKLSIINIADLNKEIYILCAKESPLRLTEFHTDMMMEKGHLLSVMYQLIVSNRVPPRPDGIFKSAAGPGYRVLRLGMEAAAAVGVPGLETVQQQLSLMEQFSRLFGRLPKKQETTPLIQEIYIPSVSQLSDIAGVRFAVTPGGGIRNVQFNEGEKIFCLPVITLKPNSGVILRNLVAYEFASVQVGSTRDLAEYVDLMCGIVDTPKDVDILRKEKIIQSDLEDEEIASIFNGIRKSTGCYPDRKATNIEKKSNIGEGVEQVTRLYETMLRVRAWRFYKRLAGSFKKFLQVLLIVFILGLIVLQAFCQIYGCSKRWFK